jgi:hypothetical protein
MDVKLYNSRPVRFTTLHTLDEAPLPYLLYCFAFSSRRSMLVIGEGRGNYKVQVRSHQGLFTLPNGFSWSGLVAAGILIIPGRSVQ